MDLGAGRRGVDMGPSAIRIAGLNSAVALLGYEVTDAGNVNVHPPEAVEEMNPRARYLQQIAAAAEELAVMTEAARETTGACVFNLEPQPPAARVAAKRTKIKPHGEQRRTIRALRDAYQSLVRRIVCRPPDGGSGFARGPM